MGRGFFVATLFVAACLSDARYACEDDMQCIVGERVGVCTAQSFCAYPAPGVCESGLRYSDLAEGALAGACVPEGEVDDDGGSSPMGTSTDGGGACVPDCADAAGPCDEAATADCVGGTCMYAPKPAGTPCDDACETAGFCDATGTCLCDDAPGDSTGADCEATCIANPPHATAACDANGICVVTCESPWENCDNDASNGCEVPVGMANQCSMNGLDPEGCWTPYCGAAPDAPDAHDFGTYHCLSCSTCREPEGSTCQWCDYDIGMWFPPDKDPNCGCGEWLDLACTP